MKLIFLPNKAIPFSEESFFFWGIIFMPLISAGWGCVAYLLLGPLSLLFDANWSMLSLQIVLLIWSFLFYPFYFMLGLPAAYLSKILKNTGQRILLILALPLLASFISYYNATWLHGFVLVVGYINVTIGLIYYFYCKKRAYILVAPMTQNITQLP